MTNNNMTEYDRIHFARATSEEHPTKEAAVIDSGQSDQTENRSYARIFCTTSPWTSVRRKWRP